MLQQRAVGCSRQHSSRTTSTTSTTTSVSSRLLHASPQPLLRTRLSSNRTATGVARSSSKDKTTGNAALDTALEVGSGLVNSAAGLVPESVPRGVAKGGVAVVSAFVAFWLLQKVVSTVLTIALLGGAAWFYFSKSGGSGSGSSSSGGSSSGSGRGEMDDPSDPLAEARRIMDKYKK